MAPLKEICMFLLPPQQLYLSPNNKEFLNILERIYFFYCLVGPSIPSIIKFLLIAENVSQLFFMHMHFYFKLLGAPDAYYIYNIELDHHCFK